MEIKIRDGDRDEDRVVNKDVGVVSIKKRDDEMLRCAVTRNTIVVVLAIVVQ